MSAGVIEKNPARTSPRAISESRRWMELALELAEAGRGLTAPNPYVGAVLVKDGRVVGKGYHKRAGGPHAEILALKEAGRSARGATLYVTLEPCCHVGRTGPCVDEIIRAGVAEVYYGIIDPNPQVNGKGARKLSRAGVKTHRGLLRRSCERLNEIYLNRFRGERPFVILKTAQTLDGRIATSSGHSRWISSPESLKLAHRLRAEVDAVVVGAATAEADNPQLTVRRVKGSNPYRVIISTSGRVSPELKLFAENNDRKTILATAARNLNGLADVQGLTVWNVRKRGKRLDLADFLEKAHQFGVNSLLVEGGGRLATSMLAQGLVDKHIVVIAPMTLGEGVNAVGDLGALRIDDAIRYSDVSFERLGPDLVFTGYPVRKGR